MHRQRCGMAAAMACGVIPPSSPRPPSGFLAAPSRPKERAECLPLVPPTAIKPRHAVMHHDDAIGSRARHGAPKMGRRGVQDEPPLPSPSAPH